MMKALFAIFAAALLAASPVHAETADEHDEFFFSGRYHPVSPQQPTTTGDKIEVLEIFWYGCPHCNDFEPYIQKWRERMPANVEFVRLPAVFRPNWAAHARAYYTAEALGVIDRIHVPMFNGIHQAKKKMAEEKDLVPLFEHAGIEKDKFLAVYKSFAIDNKVRAATEKQKLYGIRGVPAVIVNGKYRSSGGDAGSYANLIKVIDYLVAKETAAGASAAAE